MALLPPLVIDPGTKKIEKLQAGDTIAFPGSGVAELVVDADGIAGQVLRYTTNDHGDLAKADSGSTSKAVALLLVDTLTGFTGAVQVEGVVTLTTGQWDAVAGTTGGLTAGATYWLSDATAGMLAGTAPSTTGSYVVRLGVAQSTTELLLSIGPRILL